MNRFEFQSVGRLLYGENWKTELAKLLDLSPKSNIVNKMANGERAITKQTEYKLINALRVKATLINESANFLSIPSKIKIEYAQGWSVVFSQSGVSVVENNQLKYINIYEGSVIYNNATIPEWSEKQTILQNYSICAAVIDAGKKGNKDELIQLIEQWFDYEEPKSIIDISVLE